MSVQDTVVLNWSTRHGEETVFDALTDAIASLEEIDRVLLDEYRVIWETEDRNHDSTSYTITGFGTSVGETTLKIRGGRGGDYEIFPKAKLCPLDRLHSPSSWVGRRTHEARYPLSGLRVRREEWLEGLPLEHIRNIGRTTSWPRINIKTNVNDLLLFPSGLGDSEAHTPHRIRAMASEYYSVQRSMKMDVWLTTMSTNREAVINPLIAACEEGFLPDELHALENPDVGDQFDDITLMMERVVVEYGGDDPRPSVTHFDTETNF